jgi:zinc transporter 1/2/3
MYLTQGLMSAISAGMLIYVSTVEMIAGDFVFGDVDGHGHGHGHGHELLPSSATTTTIQDEERAAAAPWSSRKSSAAAAVGSNLAASSRSAQLESQDVDEEVPKQEDHHEHVDHRHHGKINKKVLAVASLFAGVGCMVLLALQE